jgi:hypothetical protein
MKFDRMTQMWVAGKLVEVAFLLEKGATMFHVIQTFSRPAQDGRLYASDACRLERGGGQILGLVTP